LPRKKSYLMILSLILLIGSFMPLQRAHAAGPTVKIATDILNVRKGPGLSYPVVAKAQRGESYVFLGEKDDWVQIQLGNGSKGWAASWLVIKESSNHNNSSISKNQTARVLTDGLRVRTGPGTDYRIIGSVNKGDHFKLLSQKGEWIEISYQGNSAWISGEFIDTAQTSQNTDSAEKPAEKVQEKKNESAGQTATVTASVLTVRNEGSLNSKAVGTVAKGEKFEIIEEANNWSKIEYQKGSFGWVASWYLNNSARNEQTPPEKVKNGTLQILHDGSNIRKEANTASPVVQRANQGETFEIKGVKNDWYEIELANGESGFIAGWIVTLSGTTLPSVQRPGSKAGLANKRIIIDPGHGGQDNGTTGNGGTLEKNLTLKTAQLLYEKLRAAGANVILTRNNDTYIPLSSRVYASHYHNADAFISIHYDSIADQSVRGMTTYYYHSFQKNLAAAVHSSVNSTVNLSDRRYRFGDYYVLRENMRNAILLELGYLSSPAEEMLVTSGQFQDQVTSGIYQGLVNYFGR
jgi:N-acetylmuramoyl-L-alanine amidase